MEKILLKDSEEADMSMKELVKYRTEKSINDLNAVWQSLSEKLYQESKEADPSNQPPSSKSSSDKKNKNDEVEEADFEEVK